MTPEQRFKIRQHLKKIKEEIDNVKGMFSDSNITIPLRDASLNILKASGNINRIDGESEKPIKEEKEEVKKIEEQKEQEKEDGEKKTLQHKNEGQEN